MKKMTSDEIRVKYKELCDTHINGSYEKLKERLDNYEIEIDDKDYRQLMLERIERMMKGNK
jgi:hypothetical protein